MYKLKEKRGITLIALVITIVVLLILAGVSIMTLTGDNGLLTRTVGAKNKTKLAEAQEIANLEYMNGKIGDYSNDGLKSSGITAGYIASKLHDDYEFEIGEKDPTDAIINKVSLVDENNNEIHTLNLDTGDDPKILKVKTETSGGNANKEYYVKVDGMYHKIDVNNNGIEIVKQGIASLGEENSNTKQTITIKVTGITQGASATVKKVVSDGEDISISSEGINVIKDDEIKITPGTGNLSGVTITASVTDLSETFSVGMKVTKLYKPTESNIQAASASVSMTTYYGTIDVIWIDTNNQPLEDQTKPLVPNYNNLGGTLSAVKIAKDGTTSAPTSNSDWYKYVAGDNKTDSKDNIWPNAINTTDGSFFVYIPRFAYRITYYSNDPTTNENPTVTGYYDGCGMWKVGQNETISVKYALPSDISTVKNYHGKDYIVHPAFCNGSKTQEEIENGAIAFKYGEWDSNLSGIWVAKYEMSQEYYYGTKWYSQTDSSASVRNVATSDTVRAVSKPNVNSWRNINIANCYTNSKAYYTDKQSHLMKNSEWGAVAYLTHSQYGRNANEVRINNNTYYMTGKSALNHNDSKSSTTNSYNTVDDNNETIGALSSSTGNISGIYDLSGGATEFVAAFVKNYSGDYFGTNDKNKTTYLDANGNHFASTNGISDKYATAYTGTNNDTGNDIYNVGLIGDAMKEVYSTQFGNAIQWFQDGHYFMNLRYPFVTRGGYCDNGATGGIFLINRGMGNSGSFRVILVH